MACEGGWAQLNQCQDYEECSSGYCITRNCHSDDDCNGYICNLLTSLCTNGHEGLVKVKLYYAGTTGLTVAGSPLQISQG
jgi:hypothetical protein